MFAFRPRSWGIAFLLVLSFTQKSWAGAEPVRSYGARWSVVVGINYDSIPKEVKLDKLKHAENDAKKFHEILAKNYGFANAKGSALMLGADAKKAAVERKIGEICDDATEDDCVIVYFSGHGRFDQEKSGQNLNQEIHGDLLMSDVQYHGDKPTDDTRISMKWICERLSNSKARHKLLILDCCYSGAVFSAGRGASVFDPSRVSDSAFRSRGFQAMTASRDTERASDGKDGNSPFTNALCEALLNMPTLQKKGKPFTTTELFSGMQFFLDQNLGADQSPRCSWLDGGQGELHFFPEGKFPDPDVPDDQIRKVMLAMVPGSFNYWWFEETPWFMPGLRYEMMAASEQKRSLSPDPISSIRMERDAIEIRNKLIGNPRPEIAKRIRHLDRFLNAKGDELEKVKKQVILELANEVDKEFLSSENNPTETMPSALPPAGEKTAGIGPVAVPVTNPIAPIEDVSRLHISLAPAAPEKVAEKEKLAAPANTQNAANEQDAQRAMDLHYLAVLRHSSGDKGYQERAKANYDKAIELYEAAAQHSTKYKALLALCLADRGWYSTNFEREHEQACQFFAKARSVYGTLTPQPFQVYVLCREAEALSKLGRRKAAEKRLKDAFAAAGEIDSNRVFPLTASLHHARAWLEMNWCEFHDAIRDFNASTKILELPANSSEEARIMCLHNAHGIAMAYRYQGANKNAVEEYRSLLEKIVDQRKKMNESLGRETDYKQIKSRLTERWVNSLERCGDCNLFGNPRDVAEAADDYRRSVRAVNFLPVDKVQNSERRARLKWALALALPNTGMQDLDLAAEQINKVNDITNELSPAAQRLEENLEMTKRFTELLLSYCRSLEPCKGNGCDGDKKLNEELESFRLYLANLTKSNFQDTRLSRDDIETAMFAMRTILEDFPDPAKTAEKVKAGRVRRLQDVELLLEFCRLGRRGAQRPMQFVRPYYDCAIASLIKLEPKNTKQLMEVVWEATQGTPHLKPKVSTPSLVFYCGTDGNYFFLDVPRGASAIYPLQSEIDFEKIRAASRSENPVDRLVLPAALRKELMAVDGEILLSWRDQLKQLGFSQITAKVAAPDVSDISSSPTVSQHDKFPFMVPGSVRLTEASLVEKLPVVKDAAPTVAPQSSATPTQSAGN
jgi:tetratricopeptide (TPR) repeat protein